MLDLTTMGDQLPVLAKNQRFQASGSSKSRQLLTFEQHGVHVLGSFIFGLPTDKPETFDATVESGAEVGFALRSFLMMTPFPGTVDFIRWEKEQAKNPTLVGDIPITRYLLIPTGPAEDVSHA